MSHLRQALDELPPTESLPTEQQLAAGLEVSRKTVRAALARLERAGIVRRIRGKGTFPARGRNARALLREAPPRIGLPLGRIAPALRGGGPGFYARIVQGVLDEILRRSCQLVLHGSEDRELALESCRLLAADSRVDGLLLLALTDQEMLAELARAGKPICLVDHFSETPGIDCVRVDSAAGSRMAIEHLHRFGHRRVGFLNARDPQVNPARLQGYVEALEAWKLPLRPEWIIESGPTVEGGEDAAMKYLALPGDDRPTALLAFSDSMALGAVQTMMRFGLSVPRDVSVIGTSGLEPVVTLGMPELTTVRFDSAELGHVAVRYLLERIADPDIETRNTMIPPALHIGHSAAPPRASRG
jgi:DNA-binding LacI/PurR family transcriptional regulator